MTWLARVIQRFLPVDSASAVDGDKLIERVDLTVEAKCPCGSQISHVLTLHSHADCPRCSRTYAIRSLEYFRRSPDQSPDMHITIGYTEQTMMKASGVH